MAPFYGTGHNKAFKYGTPEPSIWIGTSIDTGLNMINILVDIIVIVIGVITLKKLNTRPRVLYGLYKPWHQKIPTAPCPKPLLTSTDSPKKQKHITP